MGLVQQGSWGFHSILRWVWCSKVAGVFTQSCNWTPLFGTSKSHRGPAAGLPPSPRAQALTSRANPRSRSMPSRPSRPTGREVEARGRIGCPQGHGGHRVAREPLHFYLEPRKIAQCVPLTQPGVEDAVADLLDQRLVLGAEGLPLAVRHHVWGW